MLSGLRQQGSESPDVEDDLETPMTTDDIIVQPGFAPIREQPADR